MRLHEAHRERKALYGNASMCLKRGAANENRIMIHYKPHICNIHNCSNPEYKNHMCHEHYDFYMQNPAVQRVVYEVESLENKKADGKLKVKRLIQSLFHYSFDIPMPLVEHFPLEHVFLVELNTASHCKQVDSERCKRIISDFDVPENENIAAMKRVLNTRDIETSELGPKEKYKLEKKDYPSMIPIIFTVVGIFLLLGFFEWIVGTVFQVRGANLYTIRTICLQYIPYVCAFAFFVILGLMIPSSYNFFVDRCYNMTLFKRIEDNADIVNQVCYVKERKARAGSYYATLLGSSLGTIVCIFWSILGGGTPFTWQVVFFVLAVAFILVPLVFSFAEMPLFYPVIEHMKRKRVSIYLYNADRRGGLKKYHQFLYKVFLYSEGVAVVLLDVVWNAPISHWWTVLALLFVLPRFNHAVWAVVGWFRSVIDFRRAKAAEMERLQIAEGSKENMEQMELLKKTHATGAVPVLVFVLTSILIPYLVGNLPKITELLQKISINIP